MDRALREAWRMADHDSVGQALSVVDGALVADSLAAGFTGGQGVSRRDTLRAYLWEKRGFLLWRTGDRTGALRAYGELWTRGPAALPDSLVAEVIRSAAYVVTDTTARNAGALTRADTVGALRLLDRAEIAARSRGQNTVASYVNLCRARLLKGLGDDVVTAEAGACPVSQPECGPPDNTRMGLWLALALAALLLAGVWAWESHRESLRVRRVVMGWAARPQSMPGRRPE